MEARYSKELRVRASHLPPFIGLRLHRFGDQAPLTCARQMRREDSHRECGQPALRHGRSCGQVALIMRRLDGAESWACRDALGRSCERRSEYASTSIEDNAIGSKEAQGVSYALMSQFESEGGDHWKASGMDEEPVPKTGACQAFSVRVASLPPTN